MKSFYTSLDYQDLLEISGEESEKFLQGQLTCDLAHLPDGGVQLGAACNNKGRVYSSFRVMRHGQVYFLSMQPGLSAMTQKTLQKYIPFYKAQMAVVSKRFHRYGFAGEEAQRILTTSFPEIPEVNSSITAANCIISNVSDRLPRFELWMPWDDNALPQAVTASLAVGNSVDWEALDQAAGICLINAEDSELYTPEELSMDLSGFVSFDKGCYTGQEIVARMHYRGKAKKRLFAASFITADKPANTDLLDDTGKHLGSVFSLIDTAGNAYRGLVVLKTDTDPEKPRYLDTGSERIPVTVQSLHDNN
jgi:hypothetical protein